MQAVSCAFATWFDLVLLTCTETSMPCLLCGCATLCGLFVFSNKRTFLTLLIVAPCGFLRVVKQAYLACLMDSCYSCALCALPCVLKQTVPSQIEPIGFDCMTTQVVSLAPQRLPRCPADRPGARFYPRHDRRWLQLQREFLLCSSGLTLLGPDVARFGGNHVFQVIRLGAADCTLIPRCTEL